MDIFIVFSRYDYIRNNYEPSIDKAFKTKQAALDYILNDMGATVRDSVFNTEEYVHAESRTSYWVSVVTLEQ